MNRWSREDLARRVARDIPEGAYVNLGIGLPTLVADFLPGDREVLLHSENGLLGMGPKPAPGEEDSELINAGKQPVTLREGGCFFHHADSFAMMRAGYIDISVLGAFQVAVNGDLANWHTGEAGAIPSVGGAMDLAVGARRTFVMMDLFSRTGECKLVEKCTYPLTGLACVSRVYTDHGTFEVTQRGLQVIDLVDGLSLGDLTARTGLAFSDARRA
jgi:3-oxoadipate CoA-transferase, beta subunit